MIPSSHSLSAEEDSTDTIWIIVWHELAQSQQKALHYVIILHHGIP